MNTPQSSPQSSKDHKWDAETFKPITVCRRCGTTKQVKGNKPCSGKMAKIGLRGESSEDTADDRLRENRQLWAVAMNIVNQLADSWKVPVDVRQATNDEHDIFVMKVVASYLAEQEAAHRKVGQYQAADKIYSDVTTLYMLKDRMPELAHRTLDDLLKNVEAFMNDNSEAYSAYLARLKAGRRP